MQLPRKNVRYYYWLILEFIKKHSGIIFLSFLISTITVIGSITVSPYIVNSLSIQTNVIGIVGKYSADNLPDEVQSKISNGLLFVNDNGTLTPVLASSWESSKDGLTYRFHLRRDILWNDNKVFNAKDVNYSFSDVKVRPIGDYIVEFTLSKPLAIFPVYLSKPILRYPLIGVGGLYKVGRIKYENDSISELYLSPNKKDMPPIVYRFFAAESQMITAYKQGKINQMNVSKKSVADMFEGWKNTTIVRLIDYSNLYTLFFNFRTDLLKEREIRGAIDASINRSKLAEFGYEAKSSIPPTSWAYNSDLKKRVFDPDYAQKIIKKYKTATDSAKLNFNTYYDYLDIADEINRDINNIGLATNLSVSSSINPGEFDLFLVPLKIPSDPDQYYYWHSTQYLSNTTGYKNLKVDKLLEDGRSSNEIKARKQAYLDLQKTMDDDNPAVFLYFPFSYTIKRK